MVTFCQESFFQVEIKYDLMVVINSQKPKILRVSNQTEPYDSADYREDYLYRSG